MSTPRPKQASGTAVSTPERLSMTKSALYTHKQAEYLWALRRLHSQAKREKLSLEQQTMLDDLARWLQDVDQASSKEQVAALMSRFPLSANQLMDLRAAIHRAPSHSALKGKAKRRSNRVAEIAQAPHIHFSRIARGLTVYSWAIVLTLMALAAVNLLELFYFRDVPRYQILLFNLGGIVVAVSVWAFYHFRTVQNAVSQLYAHLSLHHSHDK